MAIERTVGKWFALVEDLRDAVDSSVDETTARALNGHIEPDAFYYQIAQALVQGGWVTGWPNEDEESE